MSGVVPRRAVQRLRQRTGQAPQLFDQASRLRVCFQQLRHGSVLLYEPPCCIECAERTRQLGAQPFERARQPGLHGSHPDAENLRGLRLRQFEQITVGDDFAVRLAQLRGIDVDRPRHLQKVTRTR